MQGPSNQYPPATNPPPKPGIPTWAVVLIAIAGFLVIGGGACGALAILGTRRYIANAKTAEARNALGQIAKDASIAFASSAEAPHLCASASRRVPTSLIDVRGKKYVSSPAEWAVDTGSNAGFACLKFRMDEPQYYQYSYDATGGTMTAGARGDLNGDGVASTFELSGKVVGGTLELNPSLRETNPDE